ncbi:hypothetical protein MKX01_006928 [Papaver californicum]|nr:hypothetical protein MKX01_006928 [Papaver californicum]
MDHYPELSLGNSSSFSESDESLYKKRKYQPNNDDNSTINSINKSSVYATMSITPELQLKQNYLSDFHDLQFGRRYNLSKNPIMMKKKSCKNNCQHKHQKLDLELSISNSDDDDARSSKSSLEDISTKSSSGSNMVAMGCLKCNLLVMVSKSFPSCPNCKFVNSIPKNHYHNHRQSPPRKVAKSLQTLSLLH